VTGSAARELAARVIAATAPGARPLIALDHDGTLSEIAARPEEAVLVAGAHEALLRLAVVAELAIVSGRGLDDLAARFEGHRIALISEHGLRCRLADGSIEQLTPELAGGTLEHLRMQLHDLLDGQRGWIIEDKGVAIAVHYRLVPESSLRPLRDEVLALLAAAAALPADSSERDGDPGSTASDPGGHVQTGKAVLELRPAGADKGTALRWLAARTAARPVVMIGDDATDEPALLAAETLGGFGVLVTEEADTPASHHLSGPAEVAAFLALLAGDLETRGT